MSQVWASSTECALQGVWFVRVVCKPRVSGFMGRGSLEVLRGLCNWCKCPCFTASVPPAAWWLLAPPASTFTAGERAGLAGCRAVPARCQAAVYPTCALDPWIPQWSLKPGRLSESWMWFDVQILKFTSNQGTSGETTNISYPPDEPTECSKPNSTTVRWERGAVETWKHCWWECRLDWPFRKVIIF